MRIRSQAFHARSREDYYQKCKLEGEQREGSPCRKIEEKMKKKSKAKLQKLVSDYVLEGGAFDSFTLDQQGDKETETNEQSCLNQEGTEIHHKIVKKHKNQQDEEKNDENQTKNDSSEDHNSELSSSSVSSDSDSSSSDSDSDSDNDSDDSSSEASSNKSGCKSKKISSCRNSCNNSDCQCEKITIRDHMMIVGSYGAAELASQLFENVLISQHHSLSTRSLDLFITFPSQFHILNCWTHTPSKLYENLIQEVYYKIASTFIFILSTWSQQSYDEMTAAVASSILHAQPTAKRIIFAIIPIQSEEESLVIEKAKAFAMEGGYPLVFSNESSLKFDDTTISSLKQLIFPDHLMRSKSVNENYILKDDQDHICQNSTQDSLKSADELSSILNLFNNCQNTIIVHPISQDNSKNTTEQDQDSDQLIKSQIPEEQNILQCYEQDSQKNSNVNHTLIESNVETMKINSETNHSCQYLENTYHVGKCENQDNNADTLMCMNSQLTYNNKESSDILKQQEEKQLIEKQQNTLCIDQKD